MIRSTKVIKLFYAATGATHKVIKWRV